MSCTIIHKEILPKCRFQWLRYLSGSDTNGWRWQQPATRRAMAEIQAAARTYLHHHVEDLIARPISTLENGLERTVEVMGALRYTINRHFQTCAVLARDGDGDWEMIDHQSNGQVSFDNFLSHRRWREKLTNGVRASLRGWLQERATEGSIDGVVSISNAVLHRIESAAWVGAHVARRLRSELGTKYLRVRIRAAMGFDLSILALARASRLSTKKHHVTQSWLTFVWQNVDVLSRIRRQTPGLLAPVAEYLYRHGTLPGGDPVRELTKWLISQGVTRAGFVMLAKRSARPFRSVVRRWHGGSALDALALALAHAQGPSGASPLRPALYRATYDVFDAGVSPRSLRESFAPLSPLFFAQAQTAAALHPSGVALQEFLRTEYRPVLDWWLDRSKQTPKKTKPTGKWSAWVRKAREEQARQRARVSTESWPCAFASWHTPEADVVALATPLALFEEGSSMRHCAYLYADRCSTGHVRLFSARLRHHGRIERATIGLERNGAGWRIWDIRGVCNRRLGGHWIDLARQLAHFCNTREPCLQLSLPLDTTVQDGICTDAAVVDADNDSFVCILRRRA